MGTAMGVIPSGWCNEMRSRKVNIWCRRRMKPRTWLCTQPYHETKFTRPFWLTRWGFPMKPRTDPKQISPEWEDKYCNMSRLHQQDALRRGIQLHAGLPE